MSENDTLKSSENSNVTELRGQTPANLDTSSISPEMLAEAISIALEKKEDAKKELQKSKDGLTPEQREILRKERSRDLAITCGVGFLFLLDWFVVPGHWLSNLLMLGALGIVGFAYAKYRKQETPLQQLNAQSKNHKANNHTNDLLYIGFKRAEKLWHTKLKPFHQEKAMPWIKKKHQQVKSFKAKKMLIICAVMTSVMMGGMASAHAADATTLFGWLAKDPAQMLGTSFLQGSMENVLDSSAKIYANIGFNCFTCAVMDVAYHASELLGANGYFLINISSYNLLKALLSIWLMLEVSKVLLPFGPAGQASSIFNEIFVKIGISMLAAGLLTMGATVNTAGATATSAATDNGSISLSQGGENLTFYDVTFSAYTIGPVLTVASNWAYKILSFTTEMMAKGSAGSSTDPTQAVSWDSVFGIKTGGLGSDGVFKTNTQKFSDYDENGAEKLVTESSDKAYCEPAARGGLSDAQYKSAQTLRTFTCIAAKTQQILALPLTVGIYSFLQPYGGSVAELLFQKQFSGLFAQAFSQMMAGLTITLTYGAAIFIFPVMFIEAILRMGLACMIAPLCIALGVFKSMRGPFKIIMQTIIGSGLSLVFICFAISFGSILVAQSLSLAVYAYNVKINGDPNSTDNDTKLGVLGLAKANTDQAGIANELKEVRITDLTTFFAALDGNILMKSAGYKDFLKKKADAAADKDTAKGSEDFNKILKNNDLIAGLTFRMGLHDLIFWYFNLCSMILISMMRQAHSLATQLVGQSMTVGAVQAGTQITQQMSGYVTQGMKTARAKMESLNSNTPSS